MGVAQLLRREAAPDARLGGERSEFDADVGARPGPAAARSDGRPLRRRSIDLNRMLRECLVLRAPEIEARDADVHVAELPHVRGERTLISAVFSNLLINALEYGPRERGAIVVDASASSSHLNVAGPNAARAAPASA